MKQTDKRFISRLRKHNNQIERDAEDIEWEETQLSVGDDVMAAFRRELRRGLQNLVDECLNDEVTKQEQDERTDYELLRYKLSKALGKSSEANRRYIERQQEFQRRLQN